MRIKHTSDSLRLVEFAKKYPDWHSFATDQRTKKAVKRSEVLGLIEVSDISNQFKLKGV